MTRVAACTCGQLTARTEGEPEGVSICHCLACQRRSGSVFAAQARFRVDRVVTAGASTTYHRPGDEGPGAEFHFCPTCGDTVFYVPLWRSDAIVIPVGAFADPGFPPPTMSVYEDRMHRWVTVPPGAERIA